MSPRNRKIGITLLILTQILLVVIWAVNGYEETWFYVTLILITIAAAWEPFIKKK